MNNRWLFSSHPIFFEWKNDPFFNDFTRFQVRSFLIRISGLLSKTHRKNRYDSAVLLKSTSRTCKNFISNSHYHGGVCDTGFYALRIQVGSIWWMHKVWNQGHRHLSLSLSLSLSIYIYIYIYILIKIYTNIHIYVYNII